MSSENVLTLLISLVVFVFTFDKCESCLASSFRLFLGILICVKIKRGERCFIESCWKHGEGKRKDGAEQTGATARKGAQTSTRESAANQAPSPLVLGAGQSYLLRREGLSP